MPLLTLGDPAHPLLPWLMKPYLETSSTTPQEINFNYRQSRARMVVENAFGRLKGRWWILLKRIDSKLANIPNLVVSCVVLHSMCEMYGDYCSNNWISREDTTHQNSTSTTSRAPTTSSTTTATLIQMPSETHFSNNTEISSSHLNLIMVIVMAKWNEILMKVT